MTIGSLAKKAKVTTRTIRYYEERGLIKSIITTPPGKKLYDINSLLNLQRIKLLKETGMTLDEITKTLHDLSQKPTSGKLRQHAHMHVLTNARGKILKKINQLEDLKSKLDMVLKHENDCKPCNAPDCSGCSILDEWVRFGFNTQSDDR